MAIEQQHVTVSYQQVIQLRRNGSVKRAMGFRHSPLQLGLIDRRPPNSTVGNAARGHDSQSAPGADSDGVAAGAKNDSRVDLVFGTVAIDRSARRSGNDRADPAGQRPPGQSVNQGIFQAFQRGATAGRIRDQPLGIFATRVGHREEYRDRGAPFMDDRRGKGGAFQDVKDLCVPEKDSNILVPWDRWKNSCVTGIDDDHDPHPSG